jgi:hypothetical protein
MACSKASLSFKGIPGKCANTKLNYPKYKTCGLRNPGIKDNGFFYSRTLHRVLNPCLLEIYWTDYLYKSVSTNPNEGTRAFYNSIVLYIKAMIIHLENEFGLQYSNLSSKCSAVLLVKRCLSNLFSQEEVSKIIMLLELRDSCDCLD